MKLLIPILLCALLTACGGGVEYSPAPVSTEDPTGKAVSISVWASNENEAFDKFERVYSPAPIFRIRKA